MGLAILRHKVGEILLAQLLLMQPGTVLLEHCGNGNDRWVLHLGLDVPENVTITVANQTRSWKRGKGILFDDSFRHSAVHKGDGGRLVLALQIPSPEFSR